MCCIECYDKTAHFRALWPVSHLDSVLDFPSVVSDDEGGLHDSRELDVAVSFMLTLELVQQGLISSLRETGRRDRGKTKNTQSRKNKTSNS